MNTRDRLMRECLSDDVCSDSTFWHQIYGIARSYLMTKSRGGIQDRETILEQAIVWIDDFLREGWIEVHFSKSCENSESSENRAAASFNSREKILERIRSKLHSEWAKNQLAGSLESVDDEYFCWVNLTKNGRQEAVLSGRVYSYHTARILQMSARHEGVALYEICNEVRNWKGHLAEAQLMDEVLMYVFWSMSELGELPCLQIGSRSNSGEFIAWPNPLNECYNRVRTEWGRLGRPLLEGDICVFKITAEGQGLLGKLESFADN